MQERHTAFVLLIGALVVMMTTSIGCDASRCIRNSDCASDLECSAGSCVVPASDTEGGTAPEDASTQRDARPPRHDGGTRDSAMTDDAATRDSAMTDANVREGGPADAQTEDGALDR